MIDVGDILDVVRQKFAANVAAVAGIAGGLHDSRAVGDTTGTYGVVEVQPQPHQHNALSYTQIFNVSVSLYITGTAIATQTAINLLDTALESDTRTSYTTTTATFAVLHVRKEPTAWTVEEKRDGGADVRAAKCSYEFFIEGA